MKYNEDKLQMLFFIFHQNLIIIQSPFLSKIIYEI